MLLTHRKLLITINVSNEGSKWHKLWISRSNIFKIAKESSNSSADVPSVFKIVPNYFHLIAREKIDIELSGTRKETGYVTERFYCHAVIEKIHSKQIIFEFDITAEFIEPRLKINKTKLNFCLNSLPEYPSHLKGI